MYVYYTFRYSGVCGEFISGGLIVQAGLCAHESVEVGERHVDHI